MSDLESRLERWDEELFGKCNGGERLSMDAPSALRLWKDVAEAKNALREKNHEIAGLNAQIKAIRRRKGKA